MEDTSYLQHYVNQLRPTWLGKALYYSALLRKKVTLQNMQRVFGQCLSKAQIIRLAQSFYSHLALSVYENLRMRFMSLQQIRQQAQVVGVDKLLQASADGNGAIILTGHFGNWEFAPIAGTLNFTQYHGRIHFVRRTLRNKRIERILFRRYYQAGLCVIPKQNALEQVCAALAAGDAVVFVMDQHANITNKDGILAEFFGSQAGTFRSLAMIVRHTKVPVIPAAGYRRENGKHVLEFFDPLPWIEADNAKQEIYLNTVAYNKALEKMILAHPEQWLWLHRRWKVN